MIAPDRIVFSREDHIEGYPSTILGFVAEFRRAMRAIFTEMVNKL